MPALADAARISLLAGDYDVASMTGTLPHPYSEEMAGNGSEASMPAMRGSLTPSMCGRRFDRLRRLPRP